MLIPWWGPSLVDPAPGANLLVSTNLAEKGQISIATAPSRLGGAKSGGTTSANVRYAKLRAKEARRRAVQRASRAARVCPLRKRWRLPEHSCDTRRLRRSRERLKQGGSTSSPTSLGRLGLAEGAPHIADWSGAHPEVAPRPLPEGWRKASRADPLICARRSTRCRLRRMPASPWSTPASGDRRWRKIMCPLVRPRATGGGGEGQHDDGTGAAARL